VHVGTASEFGELGSGTQVTLADGEHATVFLAKA
jgi:hypothetical protein